MILVDIYIPVINDIYDFELNENVPVRETIDVLSDIISKKMKNPLGERPDAFVLYSLEQKRALERHLTLYQNGVKDGNRLMLI